jgi:hypothetical protein
MTIMRQYEVLSSNFIQIKIVLKYEILHQKLMIVMMMMMMIIIIIIIIIRTTRVSQMKTVKIF